MTSSWNAGGLVRHGLLVSSAFVDSVYVEGQGWYASALLRKQPPPLPLNPAWTSQAGQICGAAIMQV